MNVWPNEHGVRTAALGAGATLAIARASRQVEHGAPRPMSRGGCQGLKRRLESLALALRPLCYRVRRSCLVALETSFHFALPDRVHRSKSIRGDRACRVATQAGDVIEASRA